MLSFFFHIFPRIVKHFEFNFESRCTLTLGDEEGTPQGFFFFFFSNIKVTILVTEDYLEVRINQILMKIYIIMKSLFSFRQSYICDIIHIQENKNNEIALKQQRRDSCFSFGNFQKG